MDTHNSQEVVGSLKPGGVVIGAPEELKRGFAASNRTAGDLVHRRNGFRALIPMIGLNRDEDHQGKCCLLSAGQAHTHTTGTTVNESNR